MAQDAPDSLKVRTATQERQSAAMAQGMGSQAHGRYASLAG